MSGYIRNPSGDFGPDGTMTFPCRTTCGCSSGCWAGPSPRRRSTLRARRRRTPAPGRRDHRQGLRVRRPRAQHGRPDHRRRRPRARLHDHRRVVADAATLRGAADPVRRRWHRPARGAAGHHIVFDVYVPTVFSRKLSRQAGTILTASWSRGDATMTRAIAGGPNTGTSREFGLIKDAALEAAPTATRSRRWSTRSPPSRPRPVTFRGRRRSPQPAASSASPSPCRSRRVPLRRHQRRPRRRQDHHPRGRAGLHRRAPRSEVDVRPGRRAAGRAVHRRAHRRPRPHPRAVPRLSRGRHP
jgi:hypothetical protein